MNRLRAIMKTRLSAALATAATLLLSGCGESTNIAGEGAGTVSSCSSLLNVTCVTGRLIDDAAFNVDYECGLPEAGTVRSVTASDGSFICPNGSVAKFALVNPDNRDFRIELGEVTITRPAAVYGESTVIPVYFYVTPRHLAGDTIGNDYSVRALNIVRFLQTLSDDTRDADLSRNLPTRRILISDADKRKINDTVLPEELDFSRSIAADPANPSVGSFDHDVKPYLDSLGDPSKSQLISLLQAGTAITKGIFSTFAGMYLVPGGSILSTGSLLPGDTSFDADTGAMVGYDAASDRNFVGSFYLLVDRRGRSIGSGVYSYGTGSNWAVWSNPQAMELVETGRAAAGVPRWPMDGNLTTFRFALNGDSGRFVRLDQGVMRREAVAGSDEVYRRLFKETPGAGVLGRWSMTDGSSSTTYITAGAYTLEHTVAAATYVNPDVWEHDGADFPLPITVTFYNDDRNNGACPTGRGCKIAELRMVVLEDGNLVTDRYGSCGVGVNPETLVVNGNDTMREIPIGTVANALDTLKDEAGTIRILTLLGMLPSSAGLLDAMTVEPGFEEFIPYIQFGSNLGENSLLRIDGGSGKQYNFYGFCSSALATRGVCSGTGTFQPGIATWLNGYTFMRAIKANKTSPAPANREALNENIGGLMEAKRTPACP